MALYAIIIICRGVLCEPHMATNLPDWVTPYNCNAEAFRDAQAWVALAHRGWHVQRAWCGITQEKSA